MIPFRQFAFYTVARDAAFVALAAATMMVGASFEPPLAFKIGATVALIFSIGLLIRAYLLTEERFLRSEAWRALRPEERPAGEDERRLARRNWKSCCCAPPKPPRGSPVFSIVRLWCCRPVCGPGGL